jgi:ribosomal-protein-alanine N-acetyltransferase
MEIRLATEADLAQLATISEAAGSAAHWTSHQWLDIFHTKIPARLAWIAEDRSEDNPRACGFLVAQIGFAQNGGPEWELENIAVLPEFRRHGLGRRLLSALIKQARLQGAERIFLEVRVSNLAAIRLYELAGFQQLGRRKGYYLNPTEDALILVHEV